MINVLYCVATNGDVDWTIWPLSSIAKNVCILVVLFVNVWPVKVFHSINLIVGYGSSIKLAFKLTIIPLPSETLNVVPPFVAVITPPCNNPEYILPSNQRKRVKLE